MKRLSALLAATAATCLPVTAEPILVELFASHNCQACPKAHDTLAEVNSVRDDVLILTWSVDYWDYLGEADPMAMPVSAERQSAYVDAFELRGPYTPQTVYDGRQQCPGNKPRQVNRALEDASGSTASSGAIITKSEEIGWSVRAPDTGPADVFLVQFVADAEARMGMTNPVTKLDLLAELPGGGRLLAQPDCDSGCALIIQAPGHGEVFATQRVH
ncbi:MAG: DUF1223 domain-containing protein [Pseudomonadota bacterium]